MGGSTNFRLWVAFAGGAVLATAAYYLLSRPLNTGHTSRPEPVPSAIPAIVPEAPAATSPGTQPVPPPMPQKPKGRESARRFVPSPTLLAARLAAPPAVISVNPPEVTEIETPDVLADLTSSQPSEVQAGPRTVTIPENTILAILLGERLASDRNVAGDAFFGTLAAPLVVDGWVIAERGARVLGRVADVEPAGKTKGIATLTLELSSITASDGQRISIHTARFVRKGDPSKKDDAVKIAIGTVIGGAIGAAAGGGTGAAIGAAGGAAAGAGAVVLTRGKAAVLEAETRLSFSLDRAVTVTERR